MTKYVMVEPDRLFNAVETIWTEEEILHEFWDSWCERMMEVGRESLISRDRCIEDWIIVNWASPVE